MATGAGARAKAGEGEELARELRKQVSGEVRFDATSRVLYSTDASIYQMEPVGVVIPRNVEDVLAVVEIASKDQIPVLPRCGGTSLAGQTVNHAIVMDFSKYMNQVLEVNQEERWARVEPGIVLDQLNRHLAPFGLQYAPDPTTSNRACVGGGVGNNTCGAHSVIYGKTVDHVLELRTVLSDGSEAHFLSLDGPELEARLAGSGLESEIYRQVRRIAQENQEEILARYPRIMRRVSGYNLEDFLYDGPPFDSTQGRSAEATAPSAMLRTGLRGGIPRPFNMARMVVGSEGTLCVVTEAKINLVPLPVRKALAVLHFHDIVQACEATWEILQHSPAAVELIGRMILDRCRSSLGFARLMTFVEGEPDALLVVEFNGDSEAELVGKLNALKEDMERKGLGYACVNLLEPASQANVWALRSAGLGLLMSIRGNSMPLPYVEDTAVDPQKLGEYVRRFDEIVKAHGTTAGYYGHASVGCLHIRPLVNLKNSEGVDKMVSIASAISDLVLEYGGSLSGEHGDGIMRGVWTEKMFGPKIYQAFREVKQAFDPHGIMNPGKIIDCPPMTENLRFGPEYRAVSLDTKLDFSADFGYTSAVEMCNGMGACRKMTGTMCPSYMVTREEEHSTRGRANLLRAALSGAMPGETAAERSPLASRRLYDALDLCLECKGCKAECQTGVDMAKLKYEFLDQYHKAHGRPLRARLFANINSLSRLGSRFAPMSNWAAANPLSKFILHRFLGIHAQRALPPFARPTFPEWFESSRAITTGPSPNPPLSSLGKGGLRGVAEGWGEDGKMDTVVLFNDTFMNYNYPQVGVAAVELLERAGFRVVLANPSNSLKTGAMCCGRPMISKGLLDKSRAYARHNVDLLYPFAEQGIPIVGCEPSCLLTLRDEYPDLLRDDHILSEADGKAKAVAANSYLIDEFLAMLQEKGELDLEFTDVKKKVLFHGHCHQKALVGTQHSIAALRLPPGYQVEEVNSGCCGMAGSFGYEKEHYDISLAIGRQRLFPAVESKSEDWEVAVTGISCRQQIEHGTRKKARHLVEVLRDAIR